MYDPISELTYCNCCGSIIAPEEEIEVDIGTPYIKALLNQKRKRTQRSIKIKELIKDLIKNHLELIKTGVSKTRLQYYIYSQLDIEYTERITSELDREIQLIARSLNIVFTSNNETIYRYVEPKKKKTKKEAKADLIRLARTKVRNAYKGAGRPKKKKPGFNKDGSPRKLRKDSGIKRQQIPIVASPE